MPVHRSGCRCCHPVHPISRRGLLRLGIASAATLAAGLPRSALASGKAEALMISCMDYRLADNVHGLMSVLGMTDKYDHIVLAGASAGIVDDHFAGWHETFWSHLDVAIELHGIHSVIVVDHRDCGAYKIAFGEEHTHDPAAELAQHAKVVQQLADQLKQRKPDLTFAAYLMALTGSAERIPV